MGCNKNLGQSSLEGFALSARDFNRGRGAPRPPCRALQITFAAALVLMAFSPATLFIFFTYTHANTSAISLPVLKWQRGGCFASWCQTGWYASPAVADLDGDGQPDVIWGSYDVVALDGATGALKWRGANDSRVWPGIAVVDLTGDGPLEVIVGRSGDQVTVYAANGGTVWARNPFGNGEVRTLAVADLENDGRYEVIAGRASGGATKQLTVFEAKRQCARRLAGPARWRCSATAGECITKTLRSVISNNDGFKEIIGPTDTHYITALDRNGNQLAANAIYNNSNPKGAQGVEPGGCACRPRRRPARLRQLRQRTPPQLCQQRARDCRPGQRRHQRVHRRRQRV